MLLIDLGIEFFNEGVDIFNFTFSDVLRDSILGFVCITLGLIIWLARLLYKDPDGVVRSKLIKQKST